MHINQNYNSVYQEERFVGIGAFGELNRPSVSGHPPTKPAILHQQENPDSDVDRFRNRVRGTGGTFIAIS